MDELARLVEQLVPNAEVLHVERLRGSPRATVHRVRVRSGPGLVDSVVVKAYVSAGEGYVREASALATLPPNAPAASLLGESASPAAVLMGDLGAGISLADVLLSTDAARARDTLCAWARALAMLHAATANLREKFAAELAGRQADAPVATDSMPTRLHDAAISLAELGNAAGLDWPPSAGQELVGLSERLHPNATDACPDNNVLVGDEVYLVDFEGASFWHVAWDAAYLRVPWPSCWCSWNLPKYVADEAMEHYRDIMGSVFPYVARPEFEADVAAAVVGWAFLSTSWFLRSALDDDPPPKDSRVIAPSRKAMILHRLAGAARMSEQARLPLLGALAEQWRAQLTQRWPESALQLAPAFR